MIFFYFRSSTPPNFNWKNLNRQLNKLNTKSAPGLDKIREKILKASKKALSFLYHTCTIVLSPKALFENNE